MWSHLEQSGQTRGPQGSWRSQAKTFLLLPFPFTHHFSYCLNHSNTLFHCLSCCSSRRSNSSTLDFWSLSHTPPLVCQLQQFVPSSHGRLSSSSKMKTWYLLLPSSYCISERKTLNEYVTSINMAKSEHKSINNIIIHSAELSDLDVLDTALSS